MAIACCRSKGETKCGCFVCSLIVKRALERVFLRLRCCEVSRNKLSRLGFVLMSEYKNGFFDCCHSGSGLTSDA